MSALIVILLAIGGDITMPQQLIGVALSSNNTKDALEQVEHMEDIGISAVWSTTGGVGGDALTFFGAAAVRTKKILLGTSIIPTYPRHPMVIAQQIQSIATLAPGRIRLGIGPSHKRTIENNYGINFDSPLGRLKEYIQILKTLFVNGNVDFTGKYYRANMQISHPIDVPVMASALRKRSFELCGEEADGAISWVCPREYLRDIAIPAINTGSSNVGRKAPPLIAHIAISVHDDIEETRSAARKQIGFYPKSPFYASMFSDAGFPEALDGNWSNGMLDSVVISGDESAAESKLRELFSFGATEILATPIPAGSDKKGSLERTLQLLAGISRTL